MSRKLLFFVPVLLLGFFSSITPLMGETSSDWQQNAKNASMVLYYNPGCPHCKKVISYLRSQNRTIPMKNTSNTAYRNELKALGHKGVPVLAVGGRTITGADSIINYLKQH